MDTIKRKEDATSKDTVEDLEDDESGTADETDGPSPDGPSPDGALDEEDELKDAGPI